MITQIYCDGSCRGNPGPGGWAALIKRRKQEIVISGKDMQTTNNRMELTAVIQGLEMLNSLDEEVIVYSDSKYVTSGINEWIEKWTKNDWKTFDKKIVKNIDLWELLFNLKNKYNVKFIWQRGHSTKQLDFVDRLAKQESNS